MEKRKTLLIEKTRTVAIPIEKLYKIIGAKEEEVVAQISNNGIRCIYMFTTDGKVYHELNGDLLFIIKEPVHPPR